MFDLRKEVRDASLLGAGVAVGLGLSGVAFRNWGASPARTALSLLLGFTTTAGIRLAVAYVIARRRKPPASPDP
jgi:hypothetical protein